MWASCLRSPPQEAADKLLAGEIDAAAMLASWDIPEVGRQSVTLQHGLLVSGRSSVW